MKRILFIPSVTLPFPPSKGGAVQNLIKFFIDYNERYKKLDLEITSIYDCESEKISTNYEKCKVHYINIKNKLIFKIRDKQIKYISGRCEKFIENKYIKSIKKILNDNKYDIVIFENTHKYAYILREYLNNTYKVLHLHNDYLNIDIRESKKYAEAFDEIICISNFIEKRVNEMCNVKTNVVYNGIDIERFVKNDLARENIRKSLNIPTENKVILFSGRIVKEKGVLELIKSFNRIDGNYKITLMIIGSKLYGENVTDDYMKEILELVKKSEDRIKLLGYINYDEISDYYAACDIGVLPTMWEEPLSLAVIEYLSSGMPVIISNSGGMVEIVDSKCGFIVNKGDSFINELAKKMELLITDNNLYMNYSKAAQERAKLFDKQIYCKNMMNYINNIRKEF